MHAVTMQGIAMFRFIAAVCRNETVASTGGAFFFLVLLLLGGFLLARGGEYLSVWPTLMHCLHS
jgi:ABC-2 type transporter